MKKIYLLSCYCALLFCFPVQGNAQSVVPAPASPLIRPADPVSVPASGAQIGGVSFRGEEVSIGETTFDLQTYDCMPRRLVNHGDGKVTAAWMSAFDPAGWPDRGTSVNHFDGAGWVGAGRVEAADIRTGFPAMDVLGDGTIVTAAHKTTGAPPYAMQINRLLPGTTTWEVSYVPTAEPTGLVWPYIAVGGDDGMTLHLVAINFEPTANRQIHYFRSQDGGVNWDIQDYIIPGLDSAHYGEIFASSYAIDAYENTVAIAHFGEWKDCAIFKSTDNGDSWAETKVLDFPLPLDYVDDTGYSADIVTPHNSQPDPLAIFTSDGGGTVLVDKFGTVHVAFGNRFVIDIDLTNATTEYYPPASGMPAGSDISGISYWNETMAGFQPFTVANLIDADGDLTITYAYPDTIPAYWGNNLVGFPGMGTDEDGNLYLVYSATTEDFKDDITRAQYRHTYIVRSTDGGSSWSTPYDLINPDLADEAGYYFEEAVYPSIAKWVDDRVRIMYQMDYTPDINVEHSYITPGENNMIYVELTPDLTPVSAKPVSLSGEAFQAFPNPVSDQVTVQWTGMATQSNLRIFQTGGTLLNTIAIPSENGALEIDVSSWIPGMYCLQMISGDKVILKKIMVIR